MTTPPPNPARINPPMDVLIVEDETRLRELLVDVIPDMGRSGFHATGARSGEEALRLMTAQPRDIVMLDLNLPGIDGMEVFQTIHQRWPHTAVIILTGFGDLEAARAAIRLGVVDFLIKPCHLSDVEVSLDRARRRLVELQQLENAQSNPAPLPDPPDVPSATTSSAPPPTTLEESERQMIFAALERHNGNRTAAAAALGISRRTLHYRLQDYERQGYVIP